MASDSDILFNLRADTNLLDPNFDRYILRNESISTWKKEFDKSGNSFKKYSKRFISKLNILKVQFDTNCQVHVNGDMNR